MYIHNWCTICGIALNKNHKWKEIIYFKDYTVIIIYIYIYTSILMKSNLLVIII